MNVKLISATKAFPMPMDDGGSMSMSPEELIVYIARVSNPANQMNMETSDKLLNYLIRNKHWSPFEMVDMTVEIVTSRGIAQQILRHRSFSYQEFSQRYAEVMDMEPIQIRKQADKNRQSSTDEIALIDVENLIGKSRKQEFETQELYDVAKRMQQHMKDGIGIYKDALGLGVAKECARFILPITTQTKIYMKGSVRSWIHYLQIRCDEHTQLEHRAIAQRILSIFVTLFPNTSKALEWHTAGPQTK